MLAVQPTVGKNLFTISITPQSKSPMYLKIHDVTGRVVRNITAQPSEIGHQLLVKWNCTDDAGSRLSGGVYFLRLVGEGVTQTAKLVLLN